VPGEPNFDLLLAFAAARELARRLDDTPRFYLNPFEWDHWALNGWFTFTADGRTLSNCPYEPAGVECRLLRPIPV